MKVGDVLKQRFVLEQMLGAGGMGKVFRALDLRKQEASDRNPYVAVKVLKESLRDHPGSVIALQREARKAQELSHPNIIKVYDFDRDGDCFFITMEYLTGKSLDRVIQGENATSLPQAEVERIVVAVGEALAFAHANGFVHWDLKPGNIFLAESGRVKVIDFGLARVIRQPTENDADATTFDVGSLGALTPAYASPEMIETQTPDPRGDVYSLACITYELLTGYHPFGRMPATNARDAGMTLARPRTLTKAQWKALRGALDFDIATRTPSVEAFLRDLKPDRGARSWPWRNIAAGAGLTGTAVAASMAGVLWWGGGRAPDGPAVPEPATVALRMDPPKVVPQLATQSQTAPAQVENAVVRPPPVTVPNLPSPTPMIPKPAVLEVPKPPRPADPPGTESASALMGGWCSTAMGMTLTPAEWTLALPSGARMPLKVIRYEAAGGVLLVELSGKDGRRTFWEFGDIAPNKNAMVQLRARTEGEADWREYNRYFRRCG